MKHISKNRTQELYNGVKVLKNMVAQFPHLPDLVRPAKMTGDLRVDLSLAQQLCEDALDWTRVLLDQGVDDVRPQIKAMRSWSQASKARHEITLRMHDAMHAKKIINFAKYFLNSLRKLDLDFNGDL